MSIKLRDTVRAVKSAGESIGILAPSVADAQSAATEHRQSLLAAQSALEAATLALQAAHDAGAENVEIERMEAALAAAKLEATRAEARYRGAENRLARARATESERAKGAARAKLNEANKARGALAERIDNAAIALAGALAEFNSHDPAIREAIAAGVLTNDATFALNRGPRLVSLALEKAGAIESRWIGDKKDQPNAAEVVSRDNGALAA